MRGLEGAVRVRCPGCCEADWRTRIELESDRPFICYMCLCRSPKPLPAQGLKEGCAARLRSVGRRVGGIFRRRNGEDGAVV
ncbi:hypothetical protein [Brevundimonas sp. M20]|uniref:hypothetical protein n=1 Tax=Brevundimonas sp. M20 TaxID=2591463 RepID=UPI0011472EBF|nr:hypothetical protein [Brevundimonas sp. M20]QDH72975.1 hypothetical protein FKQ52_05790 [Brevundimonas sp. M20]